MCGLVSVFKGILDIGNNSGKNILSWSAPSKNDAFGEVKQGWLSHKMRVLNQLESPGQHLVQKRKRRMVYVVNYPSQTESEAR